MSFEEKDNMLVIAGAGSSGGESHTPYEEPDNLQSSAFINVVDLIGEGQIGGLVDASRSIFLNGTALVGSDGSKNYESVSWDARVGTQNQTHLEGFANVETPYGVGVEMKTGIPVPFTVSNPRVDRVRLSMAVSALLQQKDNGDVIGSSVNFEIRMSINDGAFETLATKTITGKASSRYQRSYLIDLPKTAPNGSQATRWTFQIIRVSPESTSASLQNTLIFENYAEVINRNFTYPNSAIVGMRFDAEAFSSVPKREYLVDGLLIKVPNNYDPVTREYSGVWNGGFKLAATSNPAWILYDLLLNKRYGLGEYIDVSMIDEAKLYQIGQYCDQLVDDGFGNKEPRYTINCVVNKRAEAYDLITDICTCFNGMGFWAGDQVSFMIDAPSDPVMAFTTANIIGEFTYTGSSLKDRHSIVAVTWNDPSDNYKQVVEYVEDPDLIERYGVRKAEIQAFGCTSRGQAHRVGRWLLYTEHYQSEVVNFKAGLDSALVMPGDLIQIQDEDRSGKRMGGRLLKCEKKAAWLDDALDLNGFDQLKFAVLLEDGKFVERKVTSYTLDEIEIGSTGRTKRVTKVSWATDLEKDPVPQAVWVLSSPNLEPVLARVVNVRQGEEGDTVEISAIPHNPSKYLAIENDMMLEVPITSILDSRKQEAPKEVRIKQEIIKTQGIAKTRLVIDWDQAQGASKYSAEWKRDEGNWIPLPDTSNLSAEVDDIFAGIYTARVRAENIFGAASYYTYSKSADLQGKTGTLANVGTFNVTGVLFGYEFEWIYPFNSEDYAYVEIQSASLSDYSDAKLFAHIAYPTNTHSVTGLQGNLTTYFRIKCVDKAGNESEWSEWVEAITDADPEKVLEVLEGHIGESTLDAILSGKINSIEEVGRTAEEALEAAEGALIRAKEELNEAVEQLTNDQSVALAKEAADRAAAIAAEASARAAAIAAEAEARIASAEATLNDAVRQANSLINSAVGKEATDRAAAILAEANARAKAIADKAAEINADVAAKVKTLNDGITQEIKDRKDGDTAVLGELNAYKLSNDGAVAAVLEKAELAISNDAATSRRVDDLVTQISNDKTEITGQISEVRESVTTLEGNTNNKITALESSMNTKLNSKANASALNDYYTKTQMEDKALEIAAGEVNKFSADLVIGAKNLLPNSNFANELTDWEGPSSTVSVVVDAKNKFKKVAKVVSTATSAGLKLTNAASNAMGLESGIEYTFSGWVRAAAAMTVYPAMDGSGTANALAFAATTEWQYFVLTRKLGDNRVPRIYGKGEFYLANLQIERGNKATDWSVADADVQAAINANSKAIDDTNVVVNQIDGLVSTHASKISSLESNYDKVDAKAGTAISNAATAQQTAETAVNASQSTASSLNKLEAKFESSRDSDSLVADYLMKDPNQWVSHYNYDLTGYFVTVTDGKIGNTVFRKAEANNCWNYNLTILPKGKYKLSMWVRRTADSSGSLYFNARVANGANPNFTSSRYISNTLSSSLVPTTNEWTLVEKVWDVTDTEWEQFQFGFAIGHGSGKPTWEMQGFKVAKVISDADTDGSFASNASLNTIQKTLADADKALGTRIDDLTTTVSNDKTEVKGLIKDVSDSVTTLEGNTNNKITQLESNMNTKLGSKADATALDSYYTKTQMEDKAATIAAGKVEEFSAGLSIGGNNLFSLKNVKNYAGGNLSNAAYYVVTGRQVARSGGGSSDRIGNEIAIKDPAKGLILTFTVVSGTVDNVLYYRCLNASGTQVKAQATVTGTRSGDVVTCKIPAASIPATTAKMNIGFGGGATTYTVTDVVVVNASVASEWSANIDDVNSVINTNAEILSETKALAEDVDGRVKTQTASINSLTSRTTAVETQVDQTDQLARMLTSGKLMYADPTFKTDMSNVSRYSTGMSTFTMERVAKSSDNPTTSTHEVRLRVTDEATSRLGGFVQSITSRANAVFLMKYIIKLPVGLKLVTAANSLGTGSSDKFIGSVEGTGKYETYYRITKCGTGGSFSTGGHVYVTRVSGATLPTATAAAPIDWFLASVETYDTTDYEDIPPAVRTTLANYQQSINTLTEENAARVESINSLNTELGKKASTSSVSALEGSVSDINGKVNANTSAINTLKSQVGDKSIAEVLNNYYTKNEADTAIAGQVKEFSSKLAAVGANQLLNSEAERTSTASSNREYLMYESSAHLKAFYDANLGQDITISCEIKVPVAGTVQIYSSNSSAHNWAISTPSLAANTWTKVVVTVKPAKHPTTPTAAVSTLEFYGIYNTGRIPTVRKVQMEAGSIATAWAPSLRDTNATLSSHATAIDNTYTKAETNSAISSSVNNLQSTLETAIGKKADATALGNYYTKTQADSAISTAVNNMKSTLQTEIGKKADASALNSYYTKSAADSAIATAVNNLKTTLTTDIGKKADSSALSDYYSKADTDGALAGKFNEFNSSLVIGGTNLLKNSNFVDDADANKWTTNGGGYTKVTDAVYGSVLQTALPSGIVHAWLKLENGVEYTYSALIKTSVALTMSNNTPLHYHAGLGNTNQSKISVSAKSHTTIPANVWTRIYITFKLTGDADSFRPFIYMSGSTATLQIAWTKLERGNKATDWSASDAEMQSDIKVNATAISNTYTKTQTDSAISAAVTNLNSTLTTALGKKADASALGGYYTKAQTDSAISTAVTNLQSTLNTAIGKKLDATVINNYYTKTDIDNTVIAGKLTAFQTSVMNPAIETAKQNVDSLVIPDTRSTNQAPSWYWTNYPKKTVTEFKNGSSIGSPGGIAGYGTLTTVVPWNDSSGGAIRQIFESGDSMNVATRYSTSTTAWSAWQTDLKNLNTSITETTNTVNGVKGIKTVTIDNNGVLSGYGLISELVNGRVTSAFGINADNFYIGAPSSGKKPFIVTTTSKTINGTTYPAGTWIDSAYIANATIGSAHIADLAVNTAKIANGAITTAKIGDLQVDTLKIKDNAVTVPIAVFNDTEITRPNLQRKPTTIAGGTATLLDTAAEFGDIASITLNRSGGKCRIEGNVEIKYFQASTWKNLTGGSGSVIANSNQFLYLGIVLFRNNVPIRYMRVAANVTLYGDTIARFDGYASMPIVIDDAGTGTTTYKIRVGIGTTMASPAGIWFYGSPAVVSASLAVMEIKK